MKNKQKTLELGMQLGLLDMRSRHWQVTDKALLSKLGLVQNKKYKKQNVVKCYLEMSSITTAAMNENPPLT